MTEAVDLLLLDAEEIVTPPRTGPVSGSAMDQLQVQNGAGLAVRDGRVVEVAASSELRQRYTAKETVSASGCFVLPGFVDAHTHPVFVGTREAEFDLRGRGVGYEEITRRGGGIFRSVEDLREASDDQIRDSVRAHLDDFARAGTTTIEAKSGYGLTWSDERRSLVILQEVAEEHPVRVVKTFLGAHQMPKEYRSRREEYVEVLCKEQIPAVKDEGLAQYCDVFCDFGAFEVEESRRVLEAAQDQGLGLRIHAEELGESGGAMLAADLGAATADHLVHISDAAIDRFAERGVQPVLLPGTCFSLGNQHAPPARKMIERGLAVVIATDFNPGTSYLQSPILMVALACQILKVTVAEAITAATTNAAASVGLADETGALLPGMSADAVLVEGQSHLLLGYRLSEGPVRGVLSQGRFFAAS